MRVIYIAPKNVKQTYRRSHCTSAKRMTSILRHVTKAFPHARQGTILNSHQVISIVNNTSMVLNCALVTYIMMTADVGLPDAVKSHTQDTQYSNNLKITEDSRCDRVSDCPSQTVLLPAGPAEPDSSNT